jgi:hypothetical protein
MSTDGWQPQSRPSSKPPANSNDTPQSFQLKKTLPSLVVFGSAAEKFFLFAQQSPLKFFPRRSLIYNFSSFLLCYQVNGAQQSLSLCPPTHTCTHTRVSGNQSRTYRKLSAQLQNTFNLIWEIKESLAHPAMVARKINKPEPRKILKSMRNIA